ncbi:hypothetical protein [Rhodobacter ferrooxidans]|uniref:Uncharacterized protein n=1 Tax=Rhodobacter ferrooxidans TaxID=371731 RepID=C8RZP1_9RHOB|nr:hypothetical protein [Rhodobacter sp. SW2]EEW25838.1 hypothetical protein Rsw2DRAFT_1269 [Rhodobacter sp. SW2]
MKSILPFVLALGLALPAAAAPTLHLPDLAGQWRGAGTLTKAGAAAQRLGCKVEIRTAINLNILVIGRCATSEGADSFSLELTEAADGAVQAKNRFDPPRGLPEQMSGVIDGAVLTLGTADFGTVELRQQDQALDFAINAQNDGQPVLLQVRLERQNP